MKENDALHDPHLLETFDMTTKPTNPKDIIGIRKAPMSTVSAAVLAEVGVAMLEGALKYGRHNYRAVGVRSSVYYDGTMRHLMAWWEGRDIDPDSGMHEITKAITSLIVLRDAMIQGRVTDDRPPRSAEFQADLNVRAAALMDRYADRDPHHYTLADGIEPVAVAAAPLIDPVKEEAAQAILEDAAMVAKPTVVDLIAACAQEEVPSPLQLFVGGQYRERCGRVTTITDYKEHWRGEGYPWRAPSKTGTARWDSWTDEGKWDSLGGLAPRDLVECFNPEDAPQLPIADTSPKPLPMFVGGEYNTRHGWVARLTKGTETGFVGLVSAGGFEDAASETNWGNCGSYWIEGPKSDFDLVECLNPEAAP